jgi:hypothetical protein
MEKYLSEHSQRFSFDSWASVEHKFLYINTPKAGCTKIKLLLQEVCGLPVPEISTDIHNRMEGQFVKSIMDYSEEKQKYLLESPDVCRFCFIRNPYERVLSSYRSKIVGPKKYGDIQETIIGWRNSKDKSLPSFPEFIDFATSQPDIHRDIHWRTQYMVLHFDKINYNFIGRFENFHDDLVKLLQILKVDEKVYESIKSVENKSSGLSMKEAYSSDKLFEKVYKIYEKDFKTFNYDRAYRK